MIKAKVISFRKWMVFFREYTIVVQLESNVNINLRPMRLTDLVTVIDKTSRTTMTAKEWYSFSRIRQAWFGKEESPLGHWRSIFFLWVGFAVIGVALMVGILFLLMIAVEITLEWLGNQISKIFPGRKKAKDPEDPAALVGSFKRYK